MSQVNSVYGYNNSANTEFLCIHLLLPDHMCQVNSDYGYSDSATPEFLYIVCLEDIFIPEHLLYIRTNAASLLRCCLDTHVILCVMPKDILLNLPWYTYCKTGTVAQTL